jgi:methionine synthase II (cobalamin-independent)
LFIDEPGLTGYGSAFSTLSAETILKSLDQAIQTARSLGPVLLGCHVCGNTDWGLLSQTDFDILNFDAFSHLEPFCLYPKELGAFLDKGGYIAFGLVPTEEYDPSLTAEILLKRLDEGLKPLKRHIDLDLIRSRTLFSTSCGLGSLSEETATAILKLLANVTEAARGR